MGPKKKGGKKGKKGKKEAEEPDDIFKTMTSQELIPQVELFKENLMDAKIKRNML